MKNFKPQSRGKHALSISAIAISTLLFVSSCNKDETSPISDPLDDMISMLDLEQLPVVAHPANNASSSKKIELGRLLFWDPIVGGEKDMACVTCHHPDFAYGDGLDLPIGVNGSGLGPDRTEHTGGLSLATPIERVPRNAPTILNSGYNGLIDNNGYDAEMSPMFWDSREASLEGQCQGPPTSRSEMKGDAYSADDAVDSIILRVLDIPEYVQLFDDAFGANGLTKQNFTFAMGAFERAIFSDNSPYDQYLDGDLTALTSDQKNGLILFHGKAKCSNCHYGAMYSDYEVHVTGIQDNPINPSKPDLGLDDEHKFRTPSLRNVSLTAPYSHSGMFATLKEMVTHESEGTSANPLISDNMLDTDFSDTGLTEKEIDQIVAFIESLTDENFDKIVPSSVPSGLEVGGNIH